MSWQISWQKIKLQIKFDFQTCLPKGINICLKTSYYICIKTVQSLLMHGKLSNYTWLFELTLKHCCKDSKNADKWFVVIKDDSFVHFVETLMKFTSWIDNTFLECTEVSLFLCWRGWMPYNFNIVSTSILHYLFTWLYFDLYPWISHFAFSLSMMNKQNFLLLNLSWVDECILVKQNPPG